MPPQGVPHLKLVTSGPRVASGRAAAYYWAVSGVKKIVIVDATNTKLFNEDDIRCIESTGVEIEQICYQQDTALVQQRGKGYGEARLLEYAVNNSEFLKVDQHFYKCTGKVYCRNFMEIHNFIISSQLNQCFWHHYDDRVAFNNDWVDLRLFYTSVDYARSTLIPKFLEANDYTLAIEHCCYELLESSRSRSSAPRPKLSGMSGGLGRWYSEHELGYLDMNYPSWRW